MREELFNTYLKAGKWKSGSGSNTVDLVTGDDDKLENEVDAARKRKERMEKAVKEREEKVRTERGRVEAEIGRSRMGLSKEEGEREYMCALYLLLRARRLWRST